MFSSISYIALLAQLAVVPIDHRADAPIPFDTTIAAPLTSNVSLDLEAGGAVRIVGGDSKVVRVRVTDRGRHCADWKWTTLYGDTPRSVDHCLAALDFDGEAVRQL